MSTGRLATAAELRAAFDRSFAEAPVAAGAPEQSVLAIRVGGEPYALRVSDVASAHVDPELTRVPSPVAELLGIATFRRVLAPVYELRGLLGLPRAANPRCVVLTRGPAPVGLAFDALEGHASVPRIEVQSRRSGDPPHVRGVVHVGGAARPVLDLASLVTLAGAQSAPPPPRLSRIVEP
jgi:purine-binding chemotaxis protein CheW